MWLRDQRPYDFVGHHCVKFDAYSSFGSVDIMFSFWYVTSRDHIIKEIYDLVRDYLQIMDLILSEFEQIN